VVIIFTNTDRIRYGSPHARGRCIEGAGVLGGGGALKTAATKKKGLKIALQAFRLTNFGAAGRN
jgi:hypothetical protein